MKRLFTVIFGALLLHFIGAERAAGQVSPSADTLASIESTLPFHQLVVNSFIDMYEKGVPEKLYLHLDKPYYSAGDNIWFKGYLVNALTLKPNPLTNYIYVELIDKQDSIVQRVKIKADDFGFHNSLKLEPETPAGEYVLRAYTRWMENEDEAYFYKRILYIGNAIDDELTTQVSYQKEDDGSILATILVRNQNLEPVTGQPFSYTLNLDRRSRKNRVQTDDDGAIKIRFTPSNNDMKSNYIQLKLEKVGQNFEKTLFLPAFSEEFDVQFFPEGGHLLPLGFQQVAFKAVGSNGLGVDITGKVYNSKGEEITEFSSVHKGMGKFLLNPQRDEKYYAKIVSEGREPLTVDLPQVEPSGCTLIATRLKNYLVCRILATDDIKLDELGLIVHVKGQILAGDELDGETVKLINLDHLPPGIAHLALVHIPTNRPVAERLWFIRDNDPIYGNIEAANPAAVDKPRSKVELIIHTTDKNNIPVTGSYSMSITDQQAVIFDSLGSSIQAELLLNSDLKGHIEEPGYYFIDESEQRNYKLDLLMMTQGWTRFELFTTLQRETERYRIKAEDMSLITGRVSSVFGRAPRKSQIVVADVATNDFESIELSKTGEFGLLGFELTDTSSLLVQALNRHGEAARYSLEVDKETFPAPKADIPNLHYTAMKPVIPDHYLDLVKQTYYDEGGIRVVNIEEISVSAYAEAEYEEKMFDGVYVSRTMNQQDLSFYRGQSIGMALNRLGIQEYMERGLIDKENPNFEPGEKAYIYHNRDTIYVAVIDGTPYSLLNNGNVLDMLRVDQIDVIGYLPHYSASLGAFGMRDMRGGAIMVRLKKGEDLNRSFSQSPSLVKYDPLGIKTPKDFYQPKYEVPEVLRNPTPDRRTTIYWEPKILTDESGQATVSFYTADRPVDYNIVLEGVNEEGKLCRYRTVLRRTE